MRRGLWQGLLIVLFTGCAVSAHHSYSAFDRNRVIEVQGNVEEFAWINPHSLLKVRTDDGRLYTGEWRAAAPMQRAGVGRDTVRRGERVVVTGNPHRDLDDNGVLTITSVRRPADGWTWPAS